MHRQCEEERSPAAAAGRCCFVINLDRSPERLRAISAQLSAAGIPFQRFAAVDGQLVDLNDPEVFDRSTYAFRHGKVPAQGEIACTLSHVGVMREFLKTDAASCLILEDDAIIDADLDRLLDRLDENSGAWDMVFLYGNHRAIPLRLAMLDSTHDLVGYFARQSGSVAYLINRAAAETFVARLLPVTLPYDHVFVRAWEYGIRIRGVLPFPISTGDHASDIGGRRNKFPWYRRLTTYATRGATEARRAIHHAFVDPIWWRALLYYIARVSAPRSPERASDTAAGAHDASHARGVDAKPTRANDSAALKARARF